VEGRISGNHGLATDRAGSATAHEDSTFRIPGILHPSESGGIATGTIPPLAATAVGSQACSTVARVPHPCALAGPYGQTPESCCTGEAFKLGAAPSGSTGVTRKNGRAHDRVNGLLTSWCHLALALMKRV
jgi:hypothetical protein